jgi:microcystin-dependent protein
MSDYSLNVGNLATGFCPTTYQQMLAGFGGALSVSIPSASGISISATPPSDTSQIWFQIDSLNRFIRMFTYAQGTWLSAHPLLPGMTMWWFSALPDFATFDGGDANAAGTASGAMWQQAKDGNGDLITAQFPVTAGTLPSGAPLTVTGATNVGGEENHTLISNELPLHQHKNGASCTVAENIFVYGYTQLEAPGLATAVTGGQAITPTAQGLTGIDGGLGGSHNTMPPYVVGYLLQRTTRQFYSVI